MKTFYIIELEKCFGFAGYVKMIFTDPEQAKTEYEKPHPCFTGCEMYTVQAKNKKATAQTGKTLYTGELAYY